MGLAISSLLMLAACAPAQPDVAQGAPVYEGVETRLLEGDLVQFKVRMSNPESPQDVQAYAECAAAQYTLIRGFGFARHLRTNVYEEGGAWIADAVYTISPALPRGQRRLDAEVITANCAENGIPMV